MSRNGEHCGGQIEQRIDDSVAWVVYEAKDVLCVTVRNKLTNSAPPTILSLYSTAPKICLQIVVRESKIDT